MSTIVAQACPFVIGVDTHARTHTYAVLDATGHSLDVGTFPNTATGRARAVSWAGRRTGGDADTLWVIEGVGSYGAVLARDAAAAGYRVVEAARMPAGRAGIGKSDPIDAQRIAAAVLPLPTDRLRTPRRDDGTRAALRILLDARGLLTADRTRTVNALTALLRVVDLGIDARRPLAAHAIAGAAKWRGRDEPVDKATARAEATRLARRTIDIDTLLKTNQNRITALVKNSPARTLLDETGFGPITAATVLVAWSHPGRLHSEAAFAALAGVNPIPASSGNTTRHRLNRSGDRQLNRALNVIAMVRMVHDPSTRDYVERRRTEGKTDREIRRLLKRYLARSIYRKLNSHAAAAPDRG